MKYMRLFENTVVEVFTPPEGSSIESCFHPDIAALFQPCGDEVEVGGKFENSVYISLEQQAEQKLAKDAQIQEKIKRLIEQGIIAPPPPTSPQT